MKKVIYYTQFVFIVYTLMTSCAQKAAENAPKSDSTVVAVDTTSYNESNNNLDNSWIIGEWEVQTDVGLANLNVFNSKEASYLGDNGSYTVENGVLKLECYRDKEIATTFNLNYSNHTIELGGGYILRKKDSKNDTSNSDVIENSISSNFTSKSAVEIFLNSHIFESNEGCILKYDLGELTIDCSGGNLRFTNIKISILNENKAIITAINTANPYTAKFTINYLDGTVIDFNDRKNIFYKKYRKD